MDILIEYGLQRIKLIFDSRIYPLFIFTYIKLSSILKVHSYLINLKLID